MSTVMLSMETPEGTWELVRDTAGRTQAILRGQGQQSREAFNAARERATDVDVRAPRIDAAGDQLPRDFIIQKTASGQWRAGPMASEFNSDIRGGQFLSEGQARALAKAGQQFRSFGSFWRERERTLGEELTREEAGRDWLEFVERMRRAREGELGVTVEEVRSEFLGYGRPG